MRLALLSLLLALVYPVATSAQAPPKHEFRGAWVATVLGLDWPTCRSCSPDAQRAQLVEILDSLQAINVNAVLFQVRVEADAFYASPFEPWSYWITGEQGRDPGYDPLAVAIDEAHARGMELHAWFNPYRAERGSGYPVDPTHVTVAHPEWILDFGSIKILDPGLPEVRDYVTSVVTDVARRYDIDGVHFDDYFYPYPPNTITNEDDASFAAHGGAFDRANWRRFNVFRFVRQVRDSLAVVRPEAAFGISPFGIWKSGVPAGTSGLDAFNTVYADAVGWLDNDLIDYLTPQLYWPFGGNQDYGKLAPWWASVRNDRHLYPGHGLYRADPNTFSGSLYASTEVPRQVRFNRATEGIQGSVFFRALNLTFYPTKGFADSLRTDLYRSPALPPPMAWKSQDVPGTPSALVAEERPGTTTVDLTWDAASGGDAEARFYAVYRVPSAETGDLGAAMERSENLVAVTGATTATDVPPANDVYTYVVTSVSPNSIESAPSNAVTVQSGVATEREAPPALALAVPRPNPARSHAEVGFSLREPARVTLRVVDVLGREVARLLDDAPRASGSHTATWQTAGASSGTYLLVLEVDGLRASRPVVVTR
ncbi:glycoside hydrolase family 10 protein [Rubrivirga sp. IMCC43871]|uniref:glycoside hydrolase family 10 protein n=1 Tax=Rubrivirga sp. IMCC43871 TaxID=3391575 RepID=UPI00398FBF03